MAKRENDEDPEYKARSVALRLLARREHSRQELSQKLRQRKLDGSIISTVLDDYENEGWLDDSRFAEVYGRQRIDSGYGPLRLASDLQQRGIYHTPACVDELTDTEWTRNALLLREKRFGLSDLKDNWEEKVRQGRFLTRRGFTASQVERALAVREAADSIL